jgi:acetylornithine/N-succinyldiaminopimelate aminotransferase
MGGKDSTPLTLGQRVRLESFNGSVAASEVCKPEENYWALIGQTGEVVAPKNERQRLLIKFDVLVASFGLHCHNEIDNSLFILESDLSPLQMP